MLQGYLLYYLGMQTYFKRDINDRNKHVGQLTDTDNSRLLCFQQITFHRSRSFKVIEFLPIKCHKLSLAINNLTTFPERYHFKIEKNRYLLTVYPTFTLPLMIIASAILSQYTRVTDD